MEQTVHPRTPTRVIDRLVRAWPAALAGALAAGVAIATAELFAGLVAGAPSLVIAVGSLVISLQPPGGKEVFVSLFGTNDKLVLNVLIVAVAALVAAGAGVLAAVRFRAGAAVFAAFGLIGLAAALRQPLISPALAIVSGVGAPIAGLGTLWILLSLVPDSSVERHRGQGDAGGRSGAGSRVRAATPRTAARSGRPGSPDWSRRRFLIASAGTLGGVAVAGGFGRLLVDQQQGGGVISTSRLPRALQAVAPLTADQSLVVPGITPLVVPNDRFYRIDTALLVPHVDVETWTLEVKGMVDRPMTFTYDQLLALPLIEQYVTIACVSNRVGDHLVGNALWTGARLKDVLEMVGVQPGASQIVGRSVDDFTVGFPTEWATAPDREPMIAVGMNRVPLPADHGFPARLIVPGLYGYVSATKWLASIELTTREAVDGYWIPLGWAKDAPILTQSRIDLPQGGAAIPAGQVQVAGVAWAPDRGIARVELRIDDGDWQEARISRPISDATWVQWILPWSAVGGRHSIEVRATDGSGTVQTDQISDPAPSGARGHHRIFVTVG
jgi:DMSO/TMAO reductase YedYZ molybdopterin-dependent catalytic subunit